MPGSADQHREWAAHNEHVYRSLESETRDWAITMLFYAALHEVQAWFIDCAVNPLPENHAARRSILLRNRPTTQKIWRHFDQLYDLSRSARYDCFMPTREQLATAEDTRLRTIRDEIDRLGAVNLR